jgi:hypothetical protein
MDKVRSDAVMRWANFFYSPNASNNTGRRVMPSQDQDDEPVRSMDDRRNRMQADFCYIERISKASYADLKRRGLGPQELRIPDSKIIRITYDAHVEWRQRMAELAQSEAAVLERERRRQLASVAGKRAAASLKHISRRRSNPRRNEVA